MTFMLLLSVKMTQQTKFANNMKTPMFLLGQILT